MKIKMEIDTDNNILKDDNISTTIAVIDVNIDDNNDIKNISKKLCFNLVPIKSKTRYISRYIE